MDKKVFEERASRLEQIAAVLEKLPPEVRSQAFEILVPYATGAQSPDTAALKKSKVKDTDTADAPPLEIDDTDPDAREKFFEAFDHDKPADNVKLVAAYHYNEHGAAPFTLDELKSLANDVGVTVPDRIDMTLKQACPF